MRRHVCVRAPVRTGWCVPGDFCLPDRPCRRWPGAPLQPYGEGGCWPRRRISRSTKASRDAGPVFLNTTPHEKAALATLRPRPLPNGSIPFKTPARSGSTPPFLVLNSDTISGFRAPSRAPSRVWLEPEPPGMHCGALLAGVIPDGRGPSHIGPKLRANFFFALHTPVRSGI